MELLWRKRKFRWLKFSYLFILGEFTDALSSFFFTIGHGDKVTVNMVNVKKGYHTRGMIKMCLGQVSVWNFPIW